MVWKPAAFEFLGGTEAARRLLGKKVRVRTACLVVALHNPSKIHNVNDTAVMLTPERFYKGQEGLVGHIAADAMDMIPIAFPAIAGSAVPATLDQLMRFPMKVIRVRWRQFQDNFEISV